MNMYAYVGNDPVNFTDPLGLTADGVERPPITSVFPISGSQSDEIVVVGWRFQEPRYTSVEFVNAGSQPGATLVGEAMGGGDTPTPAPQREEQPSVSSCAYDAVAADPVGIGLALGGGAAALLTTKARIAASIAGGTIAVGAMGVSAYSKDGIGGVIALVGKGSANASGIAAVGTRFAQGADRAGGWTATAGVLYEGYKAVRRFRDCRDRQ